MVSFVGARRAWMTVALFAVCCGQVAAQQRPNLPRTADGKPNLSAPTPKESASKTPKAIPAVNARAGIQWGASFPGMLQRACRRASSTRDAPLTAS